jgi:hypothetical protein
LVREAASLGDGKVILVGHSAGGLTISAVAEQVPELLLAVVYLTEFLLPNGMQVFAMLQHETLSSSLGPGLFVGDPAVNVRSADDPYRSRLKAAFYGDVSDSEFAHAASQLHCHEPVGAVTPSGIMPGRFGTVPRHYIRCTQDRAIPLTGQDHMIATVNMAPSGARQRSTHWKAAIRHFCHSRLLCRKFSSEFTVDHWGETPHRDGLRERLLRLHAMARTGDLLAVARPCVVEAMRANPDMAAYFPRIAALAFDGFAGDVVHSRNA